MPGIQTYGYGCLSNKRIRKLLSDNPKIATKMGPFDTIIHNWFQKTETNKKEQLTRLHSYIHATTNPYFKNHSHFINKAIKNFIVFVNIWQLVKPFEKNKFTIIVERQRPLITLISFNINGYPIYIQPIFTPYLATIQQFLTAKGEIIGTTQGKNIIQVNAVKVISRYWKKFKIRLIEKEKANRWNKTIYISPTSKRIYYIVVEGNSLTILRKPKRKPEFSRKVQNLPKQGTFKQVIAKDKKFILFTKSTTAKQELVELPEEILLKIKCLKTFQPNYLTEESELITVNRGIDLENYGNILPVIAFKKLLEDFKTLHLEYELYHRDIKPQNLVVSTKDGKLEVAIVDLDTLTSKEHNLQVMAGTADTTTIHLMAKLFPYHLELPQAAKLQYSQVADEYALAITILYATLYVTCGNNVIPNDIYESGASGISLIKHPEISGWIENTIKKEYTFMFQDLIQDPILYHRKYGESRIHLANMFAWNKLIN